MISEPPGIDSKQLTEQQRHEYRKLWAEKLRETFASIGKAIDQAFADVYGSRNGGEKQ